MDVTVEVMIGAAVSIPVKFRRKGIAIQFSVAPKWNLLNNDDDVILTGTSTAGVNVGEWLVDFTVPDNYEIPGGQVVEEMTLEVYGKDTAGKERSMDYPIRVIDYADDFLPEGVIWYDGQDIDDVLVTRVAAGDAAVTISNAAGDVAETIAVLSINSSVPVRANSDVPDRFTSRKPAASYHNHIQIPAFALPESTAPYLMRYTVALQDGTTETVMHQMYWTNNRILNTAMAVRNYLDKARLTEIDPTLQWWDQELVMSTYEGLYYINGHPSELTSWKASDLPPAMQTYWMYASALHCLNTRYIAEGMTQFDFTGLNSSLTSDRKEALSYKIDELRGYLDKLEQVKKTAIRANGPGDADPTVTKDIGRGQIGMLGLSISPVNNAMNMRRISRMMRFRMYK